MNNLDAQVAVNVSVNSRDDFTPPLSNVGIKDTFNTLYGFTFGTTGTGKIDQAFVDVRTLAGGASWTPNLASGLTNRHGEAVSFSKVYVVLVKLLDTDADYPSSGLTVGGAASDVLPIFDADADTETIGPGDTFLRVRMAGVTVDGTNKNLKILNADGSDAAKYLIVILGVD